MSESNREFFERIATDGNLLNVNAVRGAVAIRVNFLNEECRLRGFHVTNKTLQDDTKTKSVYNLT